MATIHILDEATMNKIAAGEVIERPASVVKELIENSLDAGASDIRIEVLKGGKNLIRVVDNGHGMRREDASLSFLKHATSKISRIEDIEDVATLGFRGEALSSITAVARVEIITKTWEELSGTRVIVHGGTLKSIGETGAPDGTAVIVEDLFYNTPARKNYLKADSTELSHIIDLVTKQALGHNNVAFSLIHNQKEILRSPSSEHLLDTVIHIYGHEVARAMVPVNYVSRFARVGGLISQPSLTRSSQDFSSFYINGRNISSKALNAALRRGYGSFIPAGRFPLVVLKLDVERKEVDVNVHPTKKHVRLSHEREISDAVAQAVRNSLSQEDITRKMKVPGVQSFLSETAGEGRIIRETGSGFRVTMKDTERRLKRTAHKDEEREKIQKVHILGQVDNLYVIAETDKGIVIIDQHAAHERVLFEQIRESRSTDSQELIIPINLELDPRERALIKECIPYLEEFGFRIPEFGPDSFAVTAVPNVLGTLEDPTVIHDIIADILSEGRIRDETGVFERTTRSIACRGAIKAGADCSSEQMERLVRQLFAAENPYTCPHGRPTMVSFDRQELDRLFRRS